ncbi:hypothetical protein NDN08_001482 [Rhodosorus marinus]|uniref:Uncharacterized protein n=1 Tax=Rhodosorus marinus TaxID=101924 RepID=A0AAV8UQX0_9RHOD|nr:hypothetical protein NDN08_001482 [Rhodosorus marinus]
MFAFASGFVGGQIGRAPQVRSRGQARGLVGRDRRVVLKCEAGDGAETGDGAGVESKDDWRSFRARLVAQEKSGRDDARLPSRWAHEVSAVEKGCILVASPYFFNDSQEYFAQTVVFILEHGESGSCGVVLNRPLRRSEIKITGNIEGDGLEGNTEVVKDVFVGGVPGAIQLAKKGQLDPNRLRFFYGYAGWEKNQLEEEVKEGAWFVAVTSNDVVTDHCIQLPRPLWRQVLDLMGGKYAAISSKMDELDGGRFRI